MYEIRKLKTPRRCHFGDLKTPKVGIGVGLFTIEHVLHGINQSSEISKKLQNVKKDHFILLHTYNIYFPISEADFMFEKSILYIDFLTLYD